LFISHEKLFPINQIHFDFEFSILKTKIFGLELRDESLKMFGSVSLNKD